ncbi:membrane protein [Kitasatospora sp. MMS16-BH015]|uniref:hypothetical protein n=1 Tax=Kitasatospora sp. MMS16-BH015 TaxID=2018025 RepID=UPI000CA2E8C8|nr:hypothetical protein [Kitasatospora sp. MMS16-BH015]AUG78480.1 membrane protein [Kitasatospora sp. MMS16-BH015]
MAAVDAARARAQAVLRVRGRALAVAVLPAAFAVVLCAGRVTGRIGAAGAEDAAFWGVVRWVVCIAAVVALLGAAVVVRALARAVPPRTPAVLVAPGEAPELYGMITELAAGLEVPAPAGIAIVPDCDSWLEEEHPRRGPLTRRPAEPAAPVLVVGSPFLWWMRAGELRALLAPVVAGTAASADPEIAAARRFVRSLDAALGEAGRRGFTARVLRLLLGACREHSAELERAVAARASERAKAVDYGLRVAAQEQVGLAYAGWDRLLTRVALPAWRLGRHPAHLDAGVVAALTELSRRDRLADGYETRLGDRPACDLLEQPGGVDAAVSLLAAELFVGRAEPGWEPLDWADYPEQVAHRGWRLQVATLRAALAGGAQGAAEARAESGSEVGPESGAGAPGPTLRRVLDRLGEGAGESLAAALALQVARAAAAAPPAAGVPPLDQPRGGADLLVEHVTSTVCCAVIDAGVGTPGLDWLDGPVLLIGGVRRPDLALAVAEAVEQGKDAPLRGWLEAEGIRLERPVRS